jgi:hypothetical protein
VNEDTRDFQSVSTSFNKLKNESLTFVFFPPLPTLGGGWEIQTLAGMDDQAHVVIL